MLGSGSCLCQREGKFFQQRPLTDNLSLRNVLYLRSEFGNVNEACGLSSLCENMKNYMWMFTWDWFILWMLVVVCSYPCQKWKQNVCMPAKHASKFILVWSPYCSFCHEGLYFRMFSFELSKSEVLDLTIWFPTSCPMKYLLTQISVKILIGKFWAECNVTNFKSFSQGSYIF